MNISQKVLNATAGLAKVTEQVNHCGLAGNATLALATPSQSTQLRNMATATIPKELERALALKHKIEKAQGIKAVNTRPAMR